MVSAEDGILEYGPYWEGARRGVLQIQRCHNCTRLRWPPSATCNCCSSKDFEWCVVTGNGELYSWIVTHQAPDELRMKWLPYIVVLAQLSEQNDILIPGVGCDLDKGTLHQGMLLHLEILVEDEETVVVWRSRGQHEQREQRYSHSEKDDRNA
jgi:uncharacterized OB-fold protein